MAKEKETKKNVHEVVIKIGQVKEHKDTPVIRGMVFKVKHLVEVE